MVHSGLQRQVLGLYKQVQRAIRTKPQESQAAFLNYARTEFKTNAKDIKRTDVLHIEHLLRTGSKQLKLFKSPHVKSLQR
eukprot:m.245901 g.245901  ORF g.245901 m.245901 type:complete len:80 (+) comp14833_c0_seq1:78-317(+)